MSLARTSWVGGKIEFAFVVEGDGAAHTCLMQTASDHLLGYYRLQALDGRMHDFYVRQPWDGKASIEVANLTAKGLRVYQLILQGVQDDTEVWRTFVEGLRVTP